jgi:hypothetical protein
MDSMQWFVGGFTKSRLQMPLTEIVGECGVADRIGADHSNKFVLDGLGRESLRRFVARNKQIDR